MGKNKKKGKHHAGYGANQNRANTGGQRRDAGAGHGGGRVPVATSAETHFINPYTFVPIEDKEPSRKKFLRGDGEFQGEISEAKLSGYLECSLKVKSPLFIPNTNKRFKLFGTMFDNNDKKDRIFFDEFFSYDDMYGCEVGSKFGEEYPKYAPKYPRIPGSEIKGVVRNIYEQLTNSCLCVIDEENLPYKRTSKPKKAGILDVETGVLYQAERLMLNTGHRGGRANFGQRVNNRGDTIWYKTGDLVYVRPTANTYITINDGRRVDTGTRGVDNIQKTSMRGYQKGYVLIGETFGNRKHHDSVLIFCKDDDRNKIVVGSLSNDDIKRFEAVLEKYKERPHKNYHTLYDKKKSGKIKNPYLPVFYSCVKVGANTVYYLSPAMITKEVFDKTISKLLEENHFKHQPCDGSGGWCPACRLFGMVGKGEGSSEALASRLRFTDTEVIEGAEFEVPRFLPILGTPQYSSTEFYLQKPDGDPQIWNYDYRIDVQGRNRVETSYKAKLKGRKVYWLGSAEERYFDGILNVLALYDNDQVVRDYIQRKKGDVPNEMSIEELFSLRSLEDYSESKEVDMEALKGKTLSIFDLQKQMGTKKEESETKNKKQSFVENLLGSLDWEKEKDIDTKRERDIPQLCKCLIEMYLKQIKLNMTSAVRCLTKGSTKFKVYFEDVTKEELSALIFCLNLEEESFHRIGRGKPYGMGAVKIKVDEAKAVKYLLGKDAINREEHDIKLEDYKLEGSYDNAKKYILRYSKELNSNDSKLLSYPKNIDSSEIFRWFTKNRGTVGKEKIEQTLPDILDENQELKKY